MARKKITADMANRIAEKFKVLNKRIQETAEFIDGCEKLKLPVYDTVLSENFYFLCEDYILEICRGEKELVENVDWYFWEYLSSLKMEGKEPCKENAKAWDKDGNPIMYDIGSLAEYVVSYLNDK